MNYQLTKNKQTYCFNLKYTERFSLFESMSLKKVNIGEYQ